MATRLNIERRKRGWTQNELAAKLGLRSGVSVCLWEQGKRFPYDRNVVQLQDIFGMSIEELLGEDEGDDTRRVVALRGPVSANGAT